MGQILPPRPVLPLLALFSRHDDALQWGRERAGKYFGSEALASDLFDFSETAYYEKTMGPSLKKMFLVFLLLLDPAALADWKIATNGWEEEHKLLNTHLEDRPLNLDPGYLTEAKLVLATTKDRDHRLYLRDGIYAEVTLSFYHGRWESRPWTYPDYQREDYHQFFSRCRELMRANL